MSTETLTSVSTTGFDCYRTERDAPWFKDRPVMPWPARKLLEKYSGYAPSEVEKEESLPLQIHLSSPPLYHKPTPSPPLSHPWLTIPPHIQRNNARETFPFPCIGTFEFLELTLSNRKRLYHCLLSLLHSGESFLDISCCLGQDIRKLIFDGAPAQNLVGAE